MNGIDENNEYLIEKMKRDNGIKMSKNDTLLNVQSSEIIAHCSLTIVSCSLRFSFDRFEFGDGVWLHLFNFMESITRTLFVMKKNYVRFLMCRWILGPQIELNA